MKSKYELAKVASELRRHLGEDDYSYVDVFQLAQAMENLSLVFYPMSERISGMCIKGEGNVLIAINSSMTYGRQRFTMAHELYHCFFDDMDIVVCTQDIGVSSDMEKNANAFASFFLAPPAALSAAISSIKLKKSSEERIVLDRADIVKLEQLFGMSRQAMLIRLVDEDELSHEETNPMRTNVISHALSLGYADSLYRPSPEERARMTYGCYIKRAEDLLNRGLISNGKHDELLLEAFRADLVYGVDERGELVD